MNRREAISSVVGLGIGSTPITGVKNRYTWVSNIDTTDECKPILYSHSNCPEEDVINFIWCCIGGVEVQIAGQPGLVLQVNLFDLYEQEGVNANNEKAQIRRKEIVREHVISKLTPGMTLFGYAYLHNGVDFTGQLEDGQFCRFLRNLIVVVW